MLQIYIMLLFFNSLYSMQEISLFKNLLDGKSNIQNALESKLRQPALTIDPDELNIYMTGIRDNKIILTRFNKNYEIDRQFGPHGTGIIILYPDCYAQDITIQKVRVVKLGDKKEIEIYCSWMVDRPGAKYKEKMRYAFFKINSDGYNTLMGFNRIQFIE